MTRTECSAEPAVEAPLSATRACVVVPMYNEASVIAVVVRSLRERFDLVVCVDDGSSDSSAKIAKAAGATVLRHAINLGQGAALQTGISYAVTSTPARYVVTFDADGQHDPADALRMVRSAEAVNADVVLGSRFLGNPTSNVPGARRALLRLATRFTRVTTGLRVTDTHNGLRVFTTSSARDLRISSRGMAHASELLSQIAALRCKVHEVPVTVTYSDYSRAKGQSGLNAFNVLFDLFLQRVYAPR